MFRLFRVAAAKAGKARLLSKAASPRRTELEAEMPKRFPLAKFSSAVQLGGVFRPHAGCSPPRPSAYGLKSMLLHWMGGPDLWRSRHGPLHFWRDWLGS